jgi:hypothetical protein
MLEPPHPAPTTLSFKFNVALVLMLLETVAIILHEKYS